MNSIVAGPELMVGSAVGVLVRAGEGEAVAVLVTVGATTGVLGTATVGELIGLVGWMGGVATTWNGVGDEVGKITGSFKLGVGGGVFGNGVLPCGGVGCRGVVCGGGIMAVATINGVFSSSIRFRPRSAHTGLDRFIFLRIP